MYSKIWELVYMLKGSYQTNPIRIVIEIILFALVARYAFIRRVKRKEHNFVLSQKESEQLISEWEPKEMGIEEEENEEAPPTYLLSSFCPFLFNECFLPEKISPVDNLHGETSVGRRTKKEELKKIIERYGVGTCGPRGFYGTIDVQLDLEKIIAESLGVEEVVLYAHALLAVESVIRCFCKKGDVIFYDHRSSIGIKRGIYAARSKAISYTSTLDLQEKLSLEGKSKKFIVTEGIFEETGETADVLAIVKAKKTHRAFIILDESISIPILGSRGCVGFFGVDPLEVDLRIGSLAGGYESAGGFCASTYFNAEQQRLSSLAYCFSASLPAVLSYYALLNIQSVKEWEEKMENCLQIESSLSEGEEHVESGNESEFSYASRMSLSTDRPDASPKFACFCKKDRNPLINSAAVAAFVNTFNNAARISGVCARAKNDKFTPIIRIVIPEDHKEKHQVILKAFTLLKKKGIYIRVAECYEPALLLILDNSIESGTAEKIAKEIYTITADTFVSED